MDGGVGGKALEQRQHLGFALIGQEPDVDYRGRFGRNDVRLVRSGESRKGDRVPKNRVPVDVAQDPFFRARISEGHRDVRQPSTLRLGIEASDVAKKLLHSRCRAERCLVAGDSVESGDEARYRIMRRWPRTVRRNSLYRQLLPESSLFGDADAEILNLAGAVD